MNPSILIVEDEEALTLLLRYNLEAAGYEVDTVVRGDDADLRLKETIPDLVILDWMLPGISGIELCRRLRAQPDTRQLPIIMLTARGEETERVRGLAGDIELDRERRRVVRGGREIELGPTEFRLLEYLIQSPGRVFSREQLLDGIWGHDTYIDERTVDVHVGRLRKALTRAPESELDPIRTVRGSGYAFDERYGK